jgi:hypothetical protein
LPVGAENTGGITARSDALVVTARPDSESAAVVSGDLAAAGGDRLKACWVSMAVS